MKCLNTLNLGIYFFIQRGGGGDWAAFWDLEKELAPIFFVLLNVDGYYREDSDEPSSYKLPKNAQTLLTLASA